jgi:thiol-disulfide isomerase/thioredoxin
MPRKSFLLLLSVFLFACRALMPATPTPIPPSPTPLPTRTATPTRTPRPTPTHTFTSIPAKEVLIVRPQKRDGKLKQVLADHAAKARALGMKPVAEFDASWCPACKDLARLLDKKNPLMMDAFSGIYLIRLDVDVWLTQATRAGFDVPYIPAFFNLDDEGKPVGEGIDGNSWQDSSAASIAPVLKEFFNP